MKARSAVARHSELDWRLDRAVTQLCSLLTEFELRCTSPSNAVPLSVIDGRLNSLCSVLGLQVLPLRSSSCLSLLCFLFILEIRQHSLLSCLAAVVSRARCGLTTDDNQLRCAAAAAQKNQLTLPSPAPTAFLIVSPADLAALAMP